jgi:nucleotide-binding universal stress UspA family protein
LPQYKVLVPLDGSRLAEHSLVYLDALRSLGESEVLLLGVVDATEDFHSLNPGEALERETNLLSTYLREVSSDLKQHLGLEVATKVVIGTPAERIIEETSSYATDLLVISTHSRSGVRRWRLGSVADKVIRGAPCNTLAVGPKASDRSAWLDARIMEAFKSLMVPLDGSPLAEQALPVAVSFAESYGSALHLVRVVPIPLVPGGDAAYVPDLMGSLVNAARGYLENTAAKLRRPDLVTQVIVGSPTPQLEDYVTTRAIDLVVMTSHGRGGFVRTALGSVTDRLLGGDAPVLIVRPKE